MLEQRRGKRIKVGCPTSQAPRSHRQEKRIDPEIEAREKRIWARGFLGTMFFDPKLMQELRMEECTLKLLDKGGLWNLYGKAAPTYASWTVEFISTLEVLNEASKIKF